MKRQDPSLAHGIAYEPHKRLPKPSRQVCDFYLPDPWDLWIEFDGLMEVRADDKLVRKIRFYQDQCLRFVVLTRDNWESKLYEHLLCS